MLYHVPFGVSESNVLASSLLTTFYRVMEKRQDTKTLFHITKYHLVSAQKLSCTSSEAFELCLV